MFQVNGMGRYRVVSDRPPPERTGSMSRTIPNQCMTHRRPCWRLHIPNSPTLLDLMHQRQSIDAEDGSTLSQFRSGANKTQIRAISIKDRCAQIDPVRRYPGFVLLMWLGIL